MASRLARGHSRGTRQRPSLGHQAHGATAQRGVRAQGSDHQGQALQSQTAYFSQGNKVFQAAIYGPKISSEASTAFFDGLSLQ